MPPYTQWGRSRSGCYFCFYQQKIEWVRLKEKHPEYYEKAKAYEKPYEASGNTFTWSERESLAELEQPERMEAIKEEHAKRVRAKARSEEHTSELQSLMRISYAVFCLKKKNYIKEQVNYTS